MIKNKKSQGVALTLIILIIIGFLVFLFAGNILKMVNENKPNETFNSESIIGQNQNISINYSNPDLIKGDSEEILKERIDNNDNIING